MVSLRARWLATTSLALGLVTVAGCGSGDDSDPSFSLPSSENQGPENNTPSLACPEGKVTVDASALKFDGIDGHVTMGVAPELGLATFTLEAWVRREGRGVTMGTGVGGLTMVPIAGKGRGESDGSNLDCNYAMGLAGDVLGADFEDMATGANHPVLGRTKIPYGEWHHVAAAYDGARWQLFVDGKLDGEATVDATPRQDSIQHFGIATALKSTGVPAGFLKGSVDEVRVWNRARTEGEIASAMYRRVTGGGAVGRWALDAKDGGVLDSAGTTRDAHGRRFLLRHRRGARSQDTSLGRGGPAPGARSRAPRRRSASSSTTPTARVHRHDPRAPDRRGRRLQHRDPPDTQYYAPQDTRSTSTIRPSGSWITPGRRLQHQGHHPQRRHRRPRRRRLPVGGGRTP